MMLGSSLWPMCVPDFVFYLGESALVYYWLSMPLSLLELSILHREYCKIEQKKININGGVSWHGRTLEVMST